MFQKYIRMEEECNINRLLIGWSAWMLDENMMHEMWLDIRNDG